MTKEERRAYDREWRKRNADKVREKQKKWYDSHPEYHKKWKEENREKVNQQSLECWYRHKEERLRKAREYKASHREEMIAYCKSWRESHQEEAKEYYYQYYESHQEDIKERSRNYRESHCEEIKERSRNYYEVHKEEIKEKVHQYYKTKKGRGLALIRSYKDSDNKHNRGECTLTVQWILDNIFSRSCIYCGESDWHLLGCDRINNAKPHTPENVVPCCGKCNVKRNDKDFLEFALQRIGAKDSEGLVIRV